MSDIFTITEKAKEVMKKYQEEYPEVVMDRDYFPFKVTEEWGECMQSYLMFTDRGRQKGRNKEVIQKELADEMADVFGYLLLFADKEGIDLKKAISDKWFSYLV